MQASLCIDNLTDAWLPRMFAAEYAGQFDAVLPGLSRLGLPLALGGSSNHFRTDVLREVGAWDPHNVTEDADLGIRLARFGYRSIMFDSFTFEEAPISFAAWLRQRSRWGCRPAACTCVTRGGSGATPAGGACCRSISMSAAAC